MQKKSRERIMIITIDGPSGAGKGTVAEFLATRYNLHKLDTGLLYRALASILLEHQIEPEDVNSIVDLAQKIRIEDTKRDGLRTEIVAALASKIAVIPEVRSILNQIQRDFAYGKHEGFRGTILDGRDIGTVICPESPCKIYLTASQEVRANRRSKEEVMNKAPLSSDNIKNMMEERDRRDSTRSVAPLNAAPDAFLIDTSYLTIDEVCERAAYYIENFCFKTTNCGGAKV